MPSPADPFAPPDVASETPDLELQRPVGRAAAPAAPISLDARPAPPAPEARQPVRYRDPDANGRRVVVWGLAAVGAVAIGVGGFRLVRGKLAPAPQAPAQAQATAPSKPVVWRELARTDDVLVTIEVEPGTKKGTRLFLDGVPLPSNPVALPRGSSHQVSAVADGYDSASIDVTADATKSVRLRLTRARR